MKCIEQLKATAAQVGATVDDEQEDALYLDAPPGYQWRSNGATVLAEQRRNISQTWNAKACRELRERAAMGLEKVTDAAELANIQHEKDDDNWRALEGSPDRIEWPKTTK